MAKTPACSGQYPAGDEANEELSFRRKLGKVGSLQDIFELVRDAVWKALRVDQAGLLLGLAELGINRQAVLGAYYSPEANTIVMNRTMMDMVRKVADPLIYNSYCFYILLHEYLHSCGFYDEKENRQIVAALAAECFGQDHAVTKLATTEDVMAGLIRQGALAGAKENEGVTTEAAREIEFVEGVDRRNTNYIN